MNPPIQRSDLISIHIWEKRGKDNQKLGRGSEKKRNKTKVFKQDSEIMTLVGQIQGRIHITNPNCFGLEA